MPKTRRRPSAGGPAPTPRPPAGHGIPIIPQKSVLHPDPRTAEIYSTLVDPPIEGETDPNPKANFQKISECQRQNAQLLFSAIRYTEIKARLMDDPNISRQVKHRLQVASQPGSADQGRQA